MANLKYQILAFSIVVVAACGLASCEPCLDCNPDNAYPFFRMEFFNKTSLDTLSQQNTALNALLTEIEETLTGGSVSQRERDSLLNLQIITAEQIAVLQRMISDINNKLIRIDEINGQAELYYDAERNIDSFNLFRIPLDMYSDTTTISFRLGTYEASMTVSYQRGQAVDNNKLKEMAYNLRLVSHTFDSLSISRSCGRDTLCNTNRTEVYVEF